MEHFKNPKNCYKMRRASGHGRVNNIVCGDVMDIYIKVDKNKKGEEYIKEASFQTMGCVVALAVSSILTEMIKGKTLKDVKKIKEKDIIKNLGGVPKIKYHCSLLGISALKRAIEDYEKRLR